MWPLFLLPWLPGQGQIKLPNANFLDFYIPNCCDQAPSSHYIPIVVGVHSQKQAITPLAFPPISCLLVHQIKISWIRPTCYGICYCQGGCLLALLLLVSYENVPNRRTFYVGAIYFMNWLIVLLLLLLSLLLLYIFCQRPKLMCISVLCFAI